MVCKTEFAVRRPSNFEYSHLPNGRNIGSVLNGPVLVMRSHAVVGLSIGDRVCVNILGNWVCCEV